MRALRIISDVLTTTLIIDFILDQTADLGMDIRSRLSRSVPAVVEFDAAVPGGAQTRLFPSPEDFALSAQQQLTNTMQVGSHHRQRTCALKSATHPVINGTNQLISVTQRVQRTSQQDEGY